MTSSGTTTNGCTKEAIEGSPFAVEHVDHSSGSTSSKTAGSVETW